MHYCKDCQRTFNERTGTLFNFLEFPTDIVFQVLLRRLRYKLSYRDVAEFFLVTGLWQILEGFEENHTPVSRCLNKQHFALSFGLRT